MFSSYLPPRPLCLLLLTLRFFTSFLPSLLAKSWIFIKIILEYLYMWYIDVSPVDHYVTLWIVYLFLWIPTWNYPWLKTINIFKFFEVRPLISMFWNFYEMFRPDLIFHMIFKSKENMTSIAHLCWKTSDLVTLTLSDIIYWRINDF